MPRRGTLVCGRSPCWPPCTLTLPVHRERDAHSAAQNYHRARVWIQITINMSLGMRELVRHQRVAHHRKREVAQAWCARLLSHADRQHSPRLDGWRGGAGRRQGVDEGRLPHLRRGWWAGEGQQEERE
eukprot:scaffold153837_cov36-Tisochrysis_lutea.AAC.1